MQVYTTKNNERSVYINNVKTPISESAAIALETFGSQLTTIAKEIGIEVKPLFKLTDEETLKCANAVNAYQKEGAAALYLNGKLIEFQFEGTVCEADELEAKEFFNIK